MRKNFISSKKAIGYMAFTLLLTSMTGCYKDSRLDVSDPNTGTVVIPAAVYSISGTVTDAETGEPIECTVAATVGTPSDLGKGAYSVSLTKAQVGEGVTVSLTFTPADAKYKGTERTVRIEKIEDGSSIVYPVSVSLAKKAEVYKDVVYDLRFTYVDAETGAEIDAATVTTNVVPVEGQKVDNYYTAGEYLVKTAKIEGKYNASVTALSLADFQVKESEDNVSVRSIVIRLNPVTAAPAEYITVLGDIRDVNNTVVTAKEISVRDYMVEPMYNASNFYFKLEKKEGAKEIVVEAKVLNEKGDGFVPVTQKIELKDVNSYYVTVKFPFAVKDGQVNTEAGSGSTSVTVIENPELDEEGKTIEEIVTEVAGNSTETKVTVKIPAGTKIENLGTESIVITGNATTSNEATDDDEEGDGEGETGGNTGVPAEPTDGTVVLKSFTGKPDGVKFTPAIQVAVEDEYSGDLGESFELQYLNEETNTWAKDEKGGSVTYENGNYIMNVAHFSTFRAALAVDTTFTTKIDSTIVTVPVTGGANEEETPLNGFKLSYDKAEEGSKYSNYDKLVSDINAIFSNVKAQNLVLNSIKGINPAAKKAFTTKVQNSTYNIPAWTQLNSFDVKTKKEIKNYTVTVNGKKISFSVETIISVEISVTDKNMTSIGHGHGHGPGDNNVGGGIAPAE